MTPARALAAWALGAMMTAACLPNLGGANRGTKEPGDGDDGVALGRLARREIAVAPGGTFALYGYDGELLLADLVAQRAESFGELSMPSVVAFWAAGEGFFGLTAPEDPRSPTQRLFSFDVGARKLLWEQPVQRADRALRPLAGGQRLFLWGTRGNARFVGASSGQTEGLVPVEGELVDVDELPSGALLLTETPPPGRGGPRTILRVVTPEGETSCRLEVENCADEVLVSPDGARGFLAPTFCGKDPVSVVDLRGCKLEATLPGFGPVALARQGATVVAFADRDAEGPLPPELRQSPRRYHLLLIDARTLAVETLPLDDWLPRYAAPPSGRLLIVDTARKPPVQPRLIDLERRSVAPIFGPAVPLESFVVTPDERHVFAMFHGLYLLRTGRQQLDSLPLAFVPEAINRTPDGKTILLLEEDRLHLLQPDPLRFVGLISPR